MEQVGELVTIDRETLEALVYGLALYMFGDKCLCEESCTEDCQGCMWCCGVTAIRHSGVKIEEARWSSTLSSP